MKKGRFIYLDNAATTPIRPEVMRAMKKFFFAEFGNPGSITKTGVSAKVAVEAARGSVALCLQARPSEIVFTSGGTESNNLAILGTVAGLEKNGNEVSHLHFLTTEIEHASVKKCFEALAKRGAVVEYLCVKENGLVDASDLRKKIRSNTALVSIGYANGEIGVIQSIRELAGEIRHARKNSVLNQNGGRLSEKYPVFHTDACQAGLFLELNVNRLGVDLASLDAQKIYGPKGVGALFVKNGTNISPILFGGEQEGGLRPGTENVASIVGLAKALTLAEKEKKANVKKVSFLQDYFIDRLFKEIPSVVLNGDREARLPANINISIPGIDSELIVLRLDEAGIVCSTRSACSRNEDGSVVVGALDVSEDIYKSTLRFSLGLGTTKNDVDRTVRALVEAIRI